MQNNCSDGLLGVNQVHQVVYVAYFFKDQVQVLLIYFFVLGVKTLKVVFHELSVGVVFGKVINGVFLVNCDVIIDDLWVGKIHVVNELVIIFGKGFQDIS